MDVNIKLKCKNTLFTLVAAMSVYLLGVLIVFPHQDFPLNDDWVYALDVLNTSQLGHLSMTGLEMAWGIPQIWLASFFQFSEPYFHLKLRLFGVISTLMVIVLTYLLLNRVEDLNEKIKSILLISLAIFPPLFISSLSFMTDNLFLGILLLSLLLFELALEKRNIIYLVFGFLVSYIGLLQRQLIILEIIPLIFFNYKIVINNVNRERFFRSIAIFGSIIFIFLFLQANDWFTQTYHIPEAFSKFSDISLLARFKITHVCVFFLGLLLLPLSLYFPLDQKLPYNKISVISLIILFIVSIIRLVFDINAPFQGNVISVFGAFGENEILIGSRDPIFPLWIRLIFLYVGLFTFVHLLNDIDQIFKLFLPFREKIKLLLKTKISYIPGALTISFGFLYLIAIIYRGVMFDRYLFPALPAFLLIGAYCFRNKQMSFSSYKSIVALSLFFLFSITVTKDYLSWNEARWDMLNSFIQTQKNSGNNILLDKIDGGYEWNGFVKKSLDDAHSFSLSWDNVKYRVSFSPPDAEYSQLKIINKIPWNSIWPPHARYLYLIEKED